MIEHMNSATSELVSDANPCWVTQTDGRDAETREAIEADFAAGKPFRVYQYATIVTVGHAQRLMMSGFTHLRVVFQRKDLSVSALDIDLKKFVRSH